MDFSLLQRSGVFSVLSVSSQIVSHLAPVSLYEFGQAENVTFSSTLRIQQGCTEAAQLSLGDLGGGGSTEKASHSLGAMLGETFC